MKKTYVAALDLPKEHTEVGITSILIDKMRGKIWITYSSETIETSKTAIEDLDMSSKAYNFLKANDIYTLEQIVSMNCLELGKMKKIGSRVFHEIIKVVHERGLSMAKKFPNNIIPNDFILRDACNCHIVKIFGYNDLLSGIETYADLYSHKKVEYATRLLGRDGTNKIVRLREVMKIIAKIGKALCTTYSRYILEFFYIINSSLWHTNIVFSLNGE